MLGGNSCASVRLATSPERENLAEAPGKGKRPARQAIRPAMWPWPMASAIAHGCHGRAMGDLIKGIVHHLNGLGASLGRAMPHPPPRNPGDFDDQGDIGGLRIWAEPS